MSCSRIWHSSGAAFLIVNWSFILSNRQIIKALVWWWPKTDVNGKSLAPSARVLIPGQTPRRPNEEAKGILSYRITDRRGDHFDHRRDCNSKLDARENVCERVLCRGFDPHHQHGPGELFHDLWHWLCPAGESGWRCSMHRFGSHVLSA